MENTLNILINTDEDTSLPCRIVYDFKTFLMRESSVWDVEYKIQGQTATPEYVLEEQVMEAINAAHGHTVELLNPVTYVKQTYPCASTGHLAGGSIESPVRLH